MNNRDPLIYNAIPTTVSGVWGLLTSQNTLIFVSIVVTVITLLITAGFRYLSYRREKELFELKKRAVEEKLNYYRQKQGDHHEP